MAMFNSYVSLPEGKPMINCSPARNHRNRAPGRANLLAAWRAAGGWRDAAPLQKPRRDAVIRGGNGTYIYIHIIIDHELLIAHNHLHI